MHILTKEQKEENLRELIKLKESKKERLNEEINNLYKKIERLNSLKTNKVEDNFDKMISEFDSKNKTLSQKIIIFI